MARYVLEAPDELMARAKSAAARDGVSFAEWLRQAALTRLGAKPAMFVPVASEKTLCEIRNPMVPADKCSLSMGHPGEHSWKT